jgi:hypothetical protein
MPHSKLSLLLFALLAAFLSLGAVLRAYAMPTEARTTETWYAYKASVGFDFIGNVQAGQFYPRSTVAPDELVRLRLPVEPPVYRRALISRYTDSVTVKIRYQYAGDRPAQPVKARLRVDGMVVVPGVRQSPHPLVASKDLTLNGAEISGEETMVIPVAKLLNDIEVGRDKLNLNLEPTEFLIHPVLEVEMGGLKEPVTVSLTPEYKLTVHTTTVEIDEPKEDRQEKALSETRVVPVTLQMFGKTLRVDQLRQISIYALGGFLVLAVLVVWLSRRRPDNRTLLQRLGPNLLVVRSFEAPGDAAIADVRSARELLQLHTQTERPVIQVGTTYYLLDGNTCYRLTLPGE